MGEAHRELLAAVVREESGRLLAGLAGRLGGDLDLAQEALQEACAAALERWPAEGAPERPGAWLRAVALRRAFDLVRRARTRRGARDAPALEALPEEAEEARLARWEEALESSVRDDLLRMLFTCCHPALALEARVALTLHALGGLSTGEIARAFLVGEAAMAQRLARARRKIREARIPYRVPSEGELEERLEAVLAVVYLVFNEGYSASAGEALVRIDLCEEALRLAELVVELLPESGEALALCALLHLQHARRAARVSPAGELVTLEEQDRSLWERGRVERGLALAERAAAQGGAGPYLLQAAIAAEHCRAPSAAEVRWERILALYGRLVALRPGPAAALARAAALAMAEGPARGLAELERVEAEAGEALAGYPWRHTLRGELLARLGRRAEAAEALRRALGAVGTEPERRRLRRRIAELAAQD